MQAGQAKRPRRPCRMTTLRRLIRPTTQMPLYNNLVAVLPACQGRVFLLLR
ncbi:hypothetical protein CKO_00186 [Citrobacter koseri ATCC BAA-895]|uniref:Uncharacterized protein n=1 Tax=Citrobacter koseri (strain ATCC BAA-895 / CDC 4225-83 / SGSC4696) TaxID=290338 RepID=A8ACZ2_CITK8|nr:hypothetical protein CKO_00186 [Citrobacter koseri ATCC BAA-895]